MSIIIAICAIIALVFVISTLINIICEWLIGSKIWK